MEFGVVMKLIFVAVTLFIVATANPVPGLKLPTDDELYNKSVSCFGTIIGIPDNQKKQCYDKCLLESYGFFDDTTGFLVEHIAQMEMQENNLSKSDARAITEKCAIKKKASESNCDWASRGLVCLQAEQVKISNNLLSNRRESSTNRPYII